MKKILVISASSNIGSSIVGKYCKGNLVTGTYRTRNNNLDHLAHNEYVKMVHLDLNSEDSMQKLYDSIDSWDLCFFCAGNPLPVKPFFESSFEEWQESVYTNSLSQLKLLHKIISKASKDATVVFFGSGSMNKSVENFSAYTLGKTILCKMTEMLAAENPAMKFFIFGPGWFYSKIHDLIYENLPDNSEWKNKTADMLNRGHVNEEYEKIISKIDRLINMPVASVSGKNFCITDNLEKINKSKDSYKFRRMT